MHALGWVVVAAPWAIVTATGAVLVTQAVGWCGSRFVAVGQALTVVLGGLCVAAAVVGLLASSWALTLGAVVAVAGTVAVVAPATRQRAAPAGEPALTVLHANLLFENTRHEALADAVLAEAADVIACSELHPAHERALLAHPAAGGYPYRFDRAATNADGMLLWSRFPLADVDWEPMEHRPAVIATVRLPDGVAVRVVLAHPNPPTTRRGLRHWEPSLDAIHLAASGPGPPAVIVADLNAARWHPPFRRLLRRGWRDVHEVSGRGLSVSWPTAGRWPVAFVRLDHGLVGDGLGVVSVRDVDIPGSDHSGFVVALAVDGVSGAAGR